MPFEKALLYARSLKLKNEKDWKVWRKSGARPVDIPSSPDKHYKHDGWQGYGHWLGTGTVSNKGRMFLPFKQALLYARSLKLKTGNDWRVWCKAGSCPANMPTTPHKTYRHAGWQGIGHWLGTGTVAK